MSLKIKCLMICATLLFASSARANLIVNGDFETGHFSSWTQTGAAWVEDEPAFHALSGTSGNFPIDNGDYVAYFGAADGSPGTGLITQDVITEPGDSYSLTFDYGAFGTHSSSAGQAFFQVEFVDTTSNSLLLSETITDPVPTSNLSSVVDSFSFEFTAIGEQTRITFRDVSQDLISRGAILDNVNVSIAAVPEPSSLIMLVAAGLTSTSRQLVLRRAG